MRIRWMLACLAAPALLGQPPVPGKNAFRLRGRQQDVYFLPAVTGKSSPGRVLFFPGDGGWRGFAVDIGRAMASWGFDVFGVDTKHYLESFTGGGSTLKEPEVTADMREFAAWARHGAREPVHLAGWSEGAGLGLLGVADPESRGWFTGLVALGLLESSVLGWRTADNLTWITKKTPNEPSFRSLDYLAKVTTPIFMIHSSGDEYTPVEAARKMFAAAGEPKRLVLVEARNHHYDGGRDRFFQALREALEWLSKSRR
ncbi:MAG: alpha/beta hydrolase [Acidobacteria bacterium]|nr:alpha/beta hydrolase [Acidobacteriota bacterium]